MHPQSQPAPRLTKLFNATLSEINAILKELPLLQQIDKRYSQGTNGKFTLILLVVVAVLILLELMGSTLSLLIVIYYPAIKSIKVTLRLSRPSSQPPLWSIVDGPRSGSS